jgi:hypothetical protein
MTYDIEVVDGFVRLSEFPVSAELEELIVELTNRAKEGEYTEWDDMHFYSFLDYQKRWAFPTPVETAVLPSWKALCEVPASDRGAGGG